MTREVKKEFELIGSVEKEKAETEMEKCKEVAIQRIKEGGNFILAVEGNTMCCGEFEDSIASLGLMMHSFKTTAGDEAFELALKVMNAESDEELNKVYEEVLEYGFKKKVNEQIGIPKEDIDEFLKIMRKVKENNSEVEDETETV